MIRSETSFTYNHINCQCDITNLLHAIVNSSHINSTTINASIKIQAYTHTYIHKYIEYCLPSPYGRPSSPQLQTINIKKKNKQTTCKVIHIKQQGKNKINIIWQQQEDNLNTHRYTLIHIQLFINNNNYNIEIIYIYPFWVAAVLYQYKYTYIYTAFKHKQYFSNFLIFFQIQLK